MSAGRLALCPARELENHRIQESSKCVTPLETTNVRFGGHDWKIHVRCCSRRLPVSGCKFPVLRLREFHRHHVGVQAPRKSFNAKIDGFPSIFPPIRELSPAGERFAADFQHSHRVSGFLALSRPCSMSAEEVRKSATECGANKDRRLPSWTAGKGNNGDPRCCRGTDVCVPFYLRHVPCVGADDIL